jgi:hypothetical protein
MQAGKGCEEWQNWACTACLLAYYHVVHLHVMAKVVWNVAERIESKAREEEEEEEDHAHIWINPFIINK